MELVKLNSDNTQSSFQEVVTFLINVDVITILNDFLHSLNNNDMICALYDTFLYLYEKETNFDTMRLAHLIRLKATTLDKSSVSHTSFCETVAKLLLLANCTDITIRKKICFAWCEVIQTTSTCPCGCRPVPLLNQRADDYTNPLIANAIVNVKFINNNRELECLIETIQYLTTTSVSSLKLFAPYLPIIQSSGSGKTKLLIELLKEYPGSYVVFRNPGSSGAPLQSEVSSLVIQCIADNPDVQVVEMAFYIWASIRFVYDSLTIKESRSNLLPLSLALEDISRFQLKVSLDDEPNTKNQYAYMSQLIDRCKGQMSYNRNTVITSNDQIQSIKYDLSLLILNLLADIKTISNGKPFVLVFDEASYLLKQSGLNLFRTIRRVLHIINQTAVGYARTSYCNPLVTIFIGTESTISNFYKSIADDSARRHENFNKLLAPYILQTSFDCFLHETVSPDCTDLVITPIVNAIKYTSQYQLTSATSSLTDDPMVQLSFRSGRPLWWGCYKNLSFEKAVSAAIVKLETVFLENDLLAKNAYAVSLFSCTMSLEVYPSGLLPEKLVKSCMAYLLMSDLGDRSLTYIKYPSEPILALAALKLLFQDPIQLCTMIDTIHACQLNGNISKGSIGDVVCRFVLCQARFMTLTRTYNPTTVSTFIEKLYSSETVCMKNQGQTISLSLYIKELFDRRPELGNGIVNFVQFIQTYARPSLDNTTTTRDQMYISYELVRNAYLRCAALICPSPNYPGIDAIIPVLLPGDRYGAILLQFKNHSSAPWPSQWPKVLKMASPYTSNFLDPSIVPIALIYMDLGELDWTSKDDIKNPTGPTSPFTDYHHSEDLSFKHALLKTSSIESFAQMNDTNVIPCFMSVGFSPFFNQCDSDRGIIQRLRTLLGYNDIRHLVTAFNRNNEVMQNFIHSWPSDDKNRSLEHLSLCLPLDFMDNLSYVPTKQNHTMELTEESTDPSLESMMEE